MTIDDLLGKLAICVNEKTGKEGFEFVQQPFTIAFEQGKWLLLDELNLAQDIVLQCIESAIDSRVLVLHDSSSATNHTRTIKMHENFRLFATQNPATGKFKGKREALSSSFLDRFTPLVFQSVPVYDSTSMFRVS